MRDRFLSSLFTFGLVIAVTAGIGWGLYFTHTISAANDAHLSCPGLATGCTVLGHIQVTDFLGLGAIAAAVFGGAYISVRSWLRQKNIFATSTNILESVKNLAGNDKAVYDAVVKADGTIFQSDVMKQIGFSKVKTSRILDRLEAKGLVERRRRGMANLVVLRRLER